MMNCKDAKKNINMYIDGEMDENTRSRFVAHIDGCESCRAELEAKKKIVNLLNSKKEVELPAGFENNLHRALKNINIGENKSKFIYIFNSNRMKAISGIAAVLLVFMFAWGINGIMNMKMGSAEQSKDAKNTENLLPDQDIYYYDSTGGVVSPSPSKNGGQNDSNEGVVPGSDDGDIPVSNDNKLDEITDNKGSNSTSVPSKAAPDYGANAASIGLYSYYAKEITIKSSDFTSDGIKIEDVAKTFGLNVTKSSNGEKFDIKISQADYSGFENELKNVLGSSDLSVGATVMKSRETAFSEDNTNNLFVTIQLIK